MGEGTSATVGELLERDHHRIDEGFARFAESLSEPTVDRAAFDDAAHALRHHIFVEEVHHFPVVRAAGLMGPVLVMLREHGEIWDLLDAIALALDSSDITVATSLWPQLREVVDQHNMKEERIVYPAGDKQLSPDDASTTAAALTTGETPLDWTCEMAGRTTPSPS